MLDPFKVLKILYQNREKIVYREDETELKDVVAELVQQKNFQTKLRELSLKFSVGTWDGVFGQFKSVEDVGLPYTVLAVDGSQIWPDRHSGFADLALVQIGGIILEYGKEKSRAKYLSRLELVTARDVGALVLTNQAVEQFRDILELESAVQWSSGLDDKHLVLMDGSIQFLLERFSNSRERVYPLLAQRFFKAFEKLDEFKVVFVTSSPGGRSWANLLKMFVCEASYFNKELCFGQCGNDKCKLLALTSDSDLFKVLLPEATCSQEFFSVYNTGTKSVFLNGTLPNANWDGEILRLEFLSSCSEVMHVVSQVFDQVKKGYGYPVSLEEAHQEAVLTAQDQELFQALVAEVVPHSVSVSRKLQSKRNVKF